MVTRIRFSILTLLLVLSSGLFVSCSTENNKSVASKKVLNANKGEDLIGYSVRGSSITDPVYLTKENTWRDFLVNRSDHQKYWDRIIAILPPDQLRKIDEFIISYEGKGDYSLFVQPLEKSEKWVVNLNLNMPKNELGFISTLIHQVGYMVTWNTQQVKCDKKKGQCSTYYVEDCGCSVPTSYINQFYQRFWKNNIKEWASYKNKDTYFEEHLSDFVTAQAATSCDEDVNESFVNFVCLKKPAGSSLMAKKVNFFYEYPELVKMREEILFRLKKYISGFSLGSRSK